MTQFDDGELKETAFRYTPEGGLSVPPGKMSSWRMAIKSLVGISPSPP